MKVFLSPSRLAWSAGLPLALGGVLLVAGAGTWWLAANFLVTAGCLILNPRTQMLGWLLACLTISGVLLSGGARVSEPLQEAGLARVASTQVPAH